MNRLTLLLPLLLALGACGSPELPDDLRPPIVIVNLDTLRADHLGSYGYERPTSPNLDAFATESARFHWAFAQGPATPPSQASILSGLYPRSHGRVLNNDKMGEGVETLAEVLQAAGYATGAFVDGGLMARGFGLEQGFDIYDDEAGRLRAIGPKAKDWIREKAPAGPFLLLAHTYDVHSPYEQTPEPYRSMFLEEVTPPSEVFQRDVTGHVSRAFDTRHTEKPQQLTQEEIDYTIALYDGGILHVDDWFGKFLDFLRRQGLYDRSIVVVISDHGEAFQEHGVLLHDTIYSPVARVPLIVRFPGGEHAGVYEQVVETIDLMPTLLETVEAPVPTTTQGQSLLPLLRGEAKGRSFAVTESPYWGRQIALASGDFRLLFTANSRDRKLFRYRHDPLEQTDVSQRMGPETRQLLGYIQSWRTAVSQLQFEGGEAEELDPETLEQLRTLGYID